MTAARWHTLPDLQKKESPVLAENRAEESRKIDRESNAHVTQRVAALIAAFELAGYRVHRTAHGYLVVRWGLSRQFVDADELRAFARQAGVRP